MISEIQIDSCFQDGAYQQAHRKYSDYNDTCTTVILAAMPYEFICDLWEYDEETDAYYAIADDCPN